MCRWGYPLLWHAFCLFRISEVEVTPPFLPLLSLPQLFYVQNSHSSRCASKSYPGPWHHLPLSPHPNQCYPAPRQVEASPRVIARSRLFVMSDQELQGRTQRHGAQFPRRPTPFLADNPLDVVQPQPGVFSALPKV